MLEPHRLNEGQTQQSTAVTALDRVARTYGLVLDPQQLTRNHPFDGKEPTTQLLLKMADGGGLRGKLRRIKRGEMTKLATLAPAILLLRNGKAALSNGVEKNGACFALIDQLESEGSLTALYDEPRRSEFCTGEVILLKLRWRVAAVERAFSFGWLVQQLVTESKSTWRPKWRWAI
jgi:ABC-type bacteriocin/lantibiotic exporter with double-glycine peptidase domain